MSMKYVELSSDPVIQKMKESSEKWIDLVKIGSQGTVMPLNYTNFGDKIYEMEVRETDVWIISIPRSGTTWVEEMIWLLCNNLNYDAAKSTILHKRIPYLELAAMMGAKKFDNEFSNVDSIINMKSPRFIKTHLPVELLPHQLWKVKPKIIYVYRNPKDVVISQYHFFRMLHKYKGTFEQYAEIFLQDKCVYSPYWIHVLNFWKLRAEHNILYLTYDFMKQDLSAVINQTANYLGIHLRAEDIPALVNHLNFNQMKNNKSVNQEKQLLDFKIVSQPEDSVFIRKGISEEWRQVMNPELIQRFDDWSERQIKDNDFSYYY